MANLLYPLLALGAGLVLPAAASDLKLDGQAALSVPLGSSVPAVLSGGAGLPALILVDVSAGPLIIAGESVGLGFTPALTQLASGTTAGNGQFAAPLNVPNQPGLVGVPLFCLGLILDPLDPNGLDFSASVPVSVFDPAAIPTEVELAGVPRAADVHFSWVRSLRAGDALDVGLDSNRFPALIGQTVDIYVTADKDSAAWSLNPALVDLSDDGAQTVTISSGGVQFNVFTVDTGALSGDVGAGLGRGYDVVVDVNRDGLLDGGDLIDGYQAPGCYVCDDPSQAGPYAVVEALYSGGNFLGQNLFYPANIASLSDVPIVIVSHGNGHNYQWYDHLGNHLASYGYVVMSHQNNTVPGIETSSTTTLTNTEYLLGNLATIQGGVLLGHVDVHNLMWIGHSRGGEGVARAYDRIVDGTYAPINFTAGDITLISSMAPTDFLGTNSANPHGKNYHLWVAASDSDVSGCVSNDILQSYHLLSRAEDQRQSICIYGAGHGDLHAGTGGAFASGPCLLGRPAVHAVMRGYILPLAEYHLKGNLAAKDWLIRPYKDLAPQSAPVGSNPCLLVNLQFRDAAASGKLVIDNFQAPASLTQASSGASASNDLTGFAIGRMDDPDGSFTYIPGQAMNGMSQCNATDTERGAVFSYDQAGGTFLRYDLLASQTDWSDFKSVSMRVCQMARNPLTTALLGDSNFAVEITDQDGDSADILVLRVQQGIEDPYQRTGCGSGAGWANEFETVRINLLEFLAKEPDLDLDRMQSLRLRFGPGNGSNFAAMGLDDLELCAD